jgi:hypothetical protein
MDFMDMSIDEDKELKHSRREAEITDLIEIE